MRSNLKIVVPPVNPIEGQPHDPSQRGYVLHYQGPETCCPGCGRSNWWKGRIYAECAFCGVTLGLGAE